MSTRKFKRPSSARRHINLETFSPFVSANRLRNVQNLLRENESDSSKPDALLCITGIDSRYNDGTNELMHYLLFGFFEVRKQELERSGYEEETIDDLIILIRKNEVDIYCNPINYHYLLPYVSHWQNNRFHCLTETEYDDKEAAEEFKVTSFISMVKGLKCVGIPYSHTSQDGDFDKMMVEKWPIVQAYALEDYGGGGFFTMKYEIRDVGPQLGKLYSMMDPVAMEMMLTDQLSIFERQWDTLITMVNVEMASNPQRLSEEKISEPLKSFYKHGRVGSGLEEKKDGNPGPFVLFGKNTKKSFMERVVSSGTNLQGDLHTTGIGDKEHAKMMICHGVSPKGPISCTRTYFFTNSVETSNGNESVTSFSTMEDEESKLLFNVYAAMVDSVIEAVHVYCSTLSIHKARAAAVDMLCEKNNSSHHPSIHKYIQRRSFIMFDIVSHDHDGRKVELEEGVQNHYMKSVSLYVHDVVSPVNDHKVLGSLAFSEMFQDSIIDIQRDEQNGTQRYDFEVLFLTSSIPRFKSWRVRKPTEEIPTSTKQIDTLTEYGKQLMSAEMVHYSSERNIFNQGIEAELFVFEQAVVLWTQHMGRVVLDKNNVKGLRFYDADSPRTVGVLLIDIKLTTRHSIPEHLQSAENTVFITFIPKSKAYKLMYQEVLPSWKSGDSELPAVEKISTLPKSFIPMHTQQQNKLNSQFPIMSSYQKAVGLFSNLNKFMTHFAVSSVSDQPVDETLIPILLNKTIEVVQSPVVDGVTEVNTKKFKGIVVTVISGIPGSHKENLCETLLKITKNISWTVLQQPLNSNRCIVPRELQRTLTSLWTTYRRKRISDPSTPQPRVLLVTPGFMNTIDVTTAIENHPDPEVRKNTQIGAVTVCIDPLHSFMEHRMTFPSLLNQCAQGWVNNILFTSCTSIQDSNLSEIQNVIRSVNSDVAFFLAEKGEIARSGDIDAVLSEDLFNENAKIKARNLLNPGWKQGLYSQKNLAFSMNSIPLTFSQPLEKSSLIKKLRGLQSVQRGFPFEGCIFCVHGRLAFSDSNTLMDIQYYTVNNYLLIKTSEDQHRSIPNGDGSHNSTKVPSCLVFTGYQLQDCNLKDWIRTCAKQKPVKKQLLTRKDVTKEEIKKIHGDHHLDTLPAGWFYNGTQFVSFDGEKQNQHPCLEEFIHNYITERNKEIESFNAEADRTANSFVDIFE